jgi:hypothetical protein
MPSIHKYGTVNLLITSRVISTAIMRYRLQLTTIMFPVTQLSLGTEVWDEEESLYRIDGITSLSV